MVGKHKSCQQRMFIIYHPVTSTSDIRLAYESGFQGVSFLAGDTRSQQSIHDLVRSLPACIANFVTTQSTDYQQIIDIVRSFGCQNICVGENTSNEVITKIKSFSNYIRVLKLYSYSSLISNVSYQTRMKLCASDGLIFTFSDFDPYRLTPQLDFLQIAKLVEPIKKPVLFTGMHTLEQAESLVSRVLPFGIIIDKSIFPRSGMTVHEGCHILARAFIMNARGGLSSLPAGRKIKSFGSEQIASSSTSSSETNKTLDTHSPPVKTTPLSTEVSQAMHQVLQKRDKEKEEPQTQETRQTARFEST